MADIFVSYAREDRPHVQRLAADLEKLGWTVWWDRQIRAGQHYDEVIQRELEVVRAVLVLWSAHSVTSRWVKTEATEGLNRDILIPLQVDQSPVPLAFRHVQSIPFDGGALEPGTSGFNDLVESLTQLLGAPPIAPQHERAAPDRTFSFEQVDAAPRVSFRARAIIAAAAVIILVAAGTYMSFGGRPEQAPEPVVRDPRVLASLTLPPPAGAEAGAPGASSSPLADPPPPDSPSSGPSVPASEAGIELAPAELHDFVVAFLKTWSSGDVERTASYYAPAVDYFDKGTVDQTLIRQDRQAHQRRWPQVRLQLDGTVMGRQQPEGYRLTFSTHYELASAAQNAKGTTEITLLVSGSAGSFRIIGHKEGAKSSPF